MLYGKGPQTVIFLSNLSKVELPVNTIPHTFHL